MHTGVLEYCTKHYYLYGASTTGRNQVCIVSSCHHLISGSWNCSKVVVEVGDSREIEQAFAYFISILLPNRYNTQCIQRRTGFGLSIWSALDEF